MLVDAGLLPFQISHSVDSDR